MKKTFLFIAAAMMAFAATAQVKVTPYGFVRNYFNYDSRSMYTVLGGEYNAMPYDEDWQTDINTGDRVDLNDHPTAHFLSLSTRFGVKLAGPEVLGAATTGRIEADFGGFGTSNTVLRLRHAWVDLNWNGKHELRIGQDWHPLSGEIMPDALGMAAGAPFRAHSRTPQVRYKFNTASGFGVSLHALYQYQFTSSGPGAPKGSKTFADNAIVPELFLGLNYKEGPIYAQIGADMLTIRPRLTVDGHKVSESLTTISPTVYFQYVENLFSLKVRSTYAQNTAHVNQISGYGISAINPDGSQEYTPLRSTVSYIDIAYGKKYKVNMFFGYMKNLGTPDDLVSTTLYTKNDFQNVNGMWRIAPAVSYNLPHFNVGLEYELTSVQYGHGKMNADGTFDNTHTVNGSRVCLMVKYNF